MAAQLQCKRPAAVRCPGRTAAAKAGDAEGIGNAPARLAAAAAAWC